MEDLSNLLNRALRKIEADSKSNAELLASIAEKVEEVAGVGESDRPRKRARGSSEPIPVTERIMALITTEPRSAEDLAKLTGVPIRDIYRMLIVLHRRDQVRRVGAPDAPLWARALSTSELVDEIERLIRIEPRTHSELEYLTGARRTRVSGALMQLASSRGAVQIGDTETKVDPKVRRLIDELGKDVHEVTDVEWQRIAKKLKKPLAWVTRKVEPRGNGWWIPSR